MKSGTIPNYLVRGMPSYTNSGRDGTSKENETNNRGGAGEGKKGRERGGRGEADAERGRERAQKPSPPPMVEPIC